MKQTNRSGTFLLDKSDREEAKLALQEEKLEELRLKINQLQSESTLKQKVISFVANKYYEVVTLISQVSLCFCRSCPLHL